MMLISVVSLALDPQVLLKSPLLLATAARLASVESAEPLAAGAPQAGGVPRAPTPYGPGRERRSPRLKAQTPRDPTHPGGKTHRTPKDPSPRPTPTRTTPNDPRQPIPRVRRHQKHLLTTTHQKIVGQAPKCLKQPEQTPSLRDTHRPTRASARVQRRRSLSLTRR
jgi:hypothetical protein